MRNTIRMTLSAALEKVEDSPRSEWVLSWPGQVVIAGSQTYWTAHVEHGIRERSLQDYYKVMLQQV